MHEEEKDVDVESDEVPEVGREATATTSNDLLSGGEVLDKRAHHNALERRRRDHIKDSFHLLRDCIPAMEGEKVSRAHILNKATEYIRQLQKSGLLRESEIDTLKEKNEVLEEQIQALENARSLGSTESSDEILQTITEQIQARQQQQHVLQVQKPSVRTHGGGLGGVNKPSSGKVAVDAGKNGSRAAGQGAPPVTRPTSATVAGEQAKNASKATADNQQSQLNYNFLASNLKSAQSLLSALQKSTGGNLPANVKSLAARVLASPLRTQVSAPSTAPAQPVPRGIVTATTVANQSTLPTNLTHFLQKQLSTTTPTVVPSVPPSPSQIKPVAPAVSAALTTSVPASSSPSTVCSSSTPTAAANVPTPAQQITSSLLSQSISSQLMAANTLLKQSANAVGSDATSATSGVPGGGATPALPTDPQLAASELLAQVTSFLSLPTPPVPTVPNAGTDTGSTNVAAQPQGGRGQLSDGVSSVPALPPQSTESKTAEKVPSETAAAAAKVDGVESRDETRKRATPHEPEAAETVAKKPRLEQ